MASELTRITHDVTVEALAGDGLPGQTLATRLVLPEPATIAEIPRVLFCMPGGGMDCGYFDLDDEGDRSFSFAEAMARRGHVVVLMDHLGIGASSQPGNGFVLHPANLAAATAEAVGRLKDTLRQGGIECLPALEDFLSIGVGHSMGGMLTTVTQGRFSPYDGVVVMGAGPYGLYDFLDDTLKPLAENPERAHAELAGLLQARGDEAYWMVPGSPDSKKMFQGGERRGAGALRAVRAHLLGVAGIFSMIPGSWAPEAASVDVPVHLVFGEDDIGDNPHTVPAWFTGSRHVTLTVLPETGHTHFIFPARDMLWRRVHDWLVTVPG